MKSLLLSGIDALNLYSWFNRFTADTATVFMLHQVRLPGDSREISADRLAAYLAYLQKNGYNVISLADYLDALREKRRTYKTVVFTVDDGYRDFYLNAYPLFKEYGFPAAVFLTGDFIEKRLFLWWNRIEFALASTKHTEIDLRSCGLGRFSLGSKPDRSLVAKQIIEHCKRIPNDAKEDIIAKLVDELEVDISGQPTGEYEPLGWHEITKMSQNGIDFYPHSITHPIMTRIPYGQRLAELAEPKRLIEQKLGRKADIFAYPNGEEDDIDDDTIRALRETGYTAALTTTPGFNLTTQTNDFYRIHRFALPIKPQWFKQYVSGLEHLKGRYRRD
ncbi:MAG: polysaccharide deacetylase family protein [Candidatus Zixiibacteriota bacterium]|nr:MAG: polysaccharide deacetylase family protein [candidate division Zixibacteria bacterium]